MEFEGRQIFEYCDKRSREKVRFVGTVLGPAQPNFLEKILHRRSQALQVDFGGNIGKVRVVLSGTENNE